LPKIRTRHRKTQTSNFQKASAAGWGYPDARKTGSWEKLSFNRRAQLLDLLARQDVKTTKKQAINASS
jgi:hypothetical protein